tara:strand:- start:24 stop:488 length:465 start_codon:yes stop_codon:yes gene_type:complete
MPNGSNQVYLVTGSNSGNSQNYLKKATFLIEKIKNTKILSTSSVYQSKSYGPIKQKDYLNQAIHVQTKLTPFELLDQVLSIENNLGRVREERWGPRVIDIDIVFYGNEEISSPNLTIPHYDWKKRDFFIACLKEISCPFVEGNGLSLKNVKKLI